MMPDSTTRTTRRAVLKTTIGLAGGIVAGMTIPASHATAGPDAGGGIIDAHSHIWTRDVARYPLAAGTTLDDLDPPSFTTAELLRTARAEKVQRVVLIAHHKFYGFDNTYMTDAARQHPGTFKVVGMVDDTRPHPDVEMKRLLAQHVTGFRIVPAIRGEKWLDNPGMRAMWKCAAETGQAICCLINPENLPEVDAMCRRYPDTRVVIDHFARIGVDGHIHESDLAALAALARRPQTFVKISAYYALGKKQPPYHDLVPMIKRLYETFGPARLMWASDAPYQLVGDNTYRDSIALVRDHIDFVSADDRDWLLRKTAEKVYFFDA